MGVTGGLIRSIFFRNRSFGAHEHNVRINIGEKKRWSSVRSYLCGDEFNSVLAVKDSGSIKGSDAIFTMSPPPDSVLPLEDSASALAMPSDSVLALEDSASVKFLDSVPADEDSASVNNSEATVTQPVPSEAADKEHNKSEATETHIPKRHQVSISKLFRDEDAAIIIQSAFREFLAVLQATRHNKEVEEKVTKEERFIGAESPRKESMVTSIEVQTGNSAKAFSFGEQKVPANQRTRQKTRTQVLKIKEDWDHSTVSSTISKMRIQNRLEAITRRERALAYAFSQQLRICSKKKQTECNEIEPNIGWSWLERWMATRVPDSIPVEPRANSQSDMAKRNQRLEIKKRSFDVTDELESCGSNDVSVQLESMSVTPADENEDSRPGKKSLKATRNISKRKSEPSYQIQRCCTKRQATKRDLQRETQRAKKAKSNQQGCERETKCKEASP